MTAIALTIAGSDPSGGSGLQQDLFTFARAGVWGLSVVTAITAQDAGGVRAVAAVEPSLLAAQLEAASAVGFGAVKTGLLPTVASVEAIAALGVDGLVVDPVAVSSSGHRLAEADVLGAIASELLPRARLITPNAAEASALTGIEVTDIATQVEAARVLADAGGSALVTGGHLTGDRIVDVLVDSGEVVELSAARWPGGSQIRGTGCRLSAGVTALLARGMDLRAAVDGAIGFVRQGIEGARDVGGVRVLGGFG